jgi:tRNA threonylcarbamoyladenosine biosynthesis protein TsaE
MKPVDVSDRVIMLPDERATRHLGALLAALARVPDVILLSGTLGAGKSTLARAFVRAWLGDEDAEVPSPTFTLVQPYEGPRGAVWHCDLYRLGDPEEVLELGLDEAFADAVSLIEWPDRLGSLLPADRLEITLEPYLIEPGRDEADDGTARRATLVAHGSWVARAETLSGEKA